MVNDREVQVFKHYDHDRDGYISQAEFRQISGNFPFIDPFGAIDLDRLVHLASTFFDIHGIFIDPNINCEDSVQIS